MVLDSFSEKKLLFQFLKKNFRVAVVGPGCFLQDMEAFCRASGALHPQFEKYPHSLGILLQKHVNSYIGWNVWRLM